MKRHIKRFFFFLPGESVVAMFGILFVTALIFIVILGDNIREAIWLIPHDRIKPFSDILNGRLAGFWVYAAACLAIVVRNYRSFAAQSRSNYVMKRTKSGFEIHRMCLTVPVIGLIAGLLLTYLVALGYQAEYTRIFSSFSIPAEYFDFNFWRALI